MGSAWCISLLSGRSIDWGGMKRDAIELAEREQDLDQLLSQWHTWQHVSRVTAGHGRQSAGFGSYRTSRQYDDANGALDSDLDNIRCKAVDVAAQQMQDPHRAAIYVLARNLCTGHAVWQSPRLPQDREARAVIVTQARAQMMARLVSAGVMED